jgi:hypothetical protein
MLSADSGRQVTHRLLLFAVLVVLDSPAAVLELNGCSQKAGKDSLKSEKSDAFRLSM